MSSPGWPYPRIVAHRGGGTLAPENTLGALRYGAAQGFSGVEFDVMLAGDGTPVLIHDETLERTTSGRGSVCATPYAEIGKLDAGGWHSARFRGEIVPAYAAATRLCRALGLWANVEIKPAKGFEAATGRAAAQMTLELWQGADPAPLLSSFSQEALAAAKEAAPGLRRGLIVSKIPDDWQARLGDLGCVSLHCNYRNVDEALVGQVHAAGYALLCWTVNDPQAAGKLLGWGVDCVVTDRLDLIGPQFST